MASIFDGIQCLNCVYLIQLISGRLDTARSRVFDVAYFLYEM